MRKSSRNVRQPDEVIGDQVACHEVQRRPRTSEVWLATAEHDRAKVHSILVDKPGFGQTVRKRRTTHENLAREVALEMAYSILEVIRN